jgi:hypothetical protein
LKLSASINSSETGVAVRCERRHSRESTSSNLRLEEAAAI